jgi:hypothetical protein
MRRVSVYVQEGQTVQGLYGIPPEYQICVAQHRKGIRP